MTKKEIARRVSDDTGISRVLASKVVQMVLDSIVEAVVAEGRIELRNFGVFEVRRRRPMTARNPKTGENVEVPERLVVRFAPGKEMEARVSEALAWKIGPSEVEAAVESVGSNDETRAQFGR